MRDIPIGSREIGDSTVASNFHPWMAGFRPPFGTDDSEGSDPRCDRSPVGATWSSSCLHSSSSSSTSWPREGGYSSSFCEWDAGLFQFDSIRDSIFLFGHSVWKGRGEGGGGVIGRDSIFLFGHSVWKGQGEGGGGVIGRDSIFLFGHSVWKGRGEGGGSVIGRDSIFLFGHSV
jgi:hypothetical protein